MLIGNILRKNHSIFGDDPYVCISGGLLSTCHKKSWMNCNVIVCADSAILRKK